MTKKLLIMVIIATNICCFNTKAQTQTYTVQPGDSLFTISVKFATTVDELKRLNGMIKDSKLIYVGQNIVVAETGNDELQKCYIEYTVIRGDTLGSIAEKFGTNIDYLKTLNNLSKDMIFEGQMLKVPADYEYYTVVRNDTLYKLSKQFNMTIDEIKTYSNLKSNDLVIGQKIKIPNKNRSPIDPPPVAPSAPDTKPTISYKTHKVSSGENSWSIAVKYGIPMAELLQSNKLNTESILNLGQELKIPVHNVPIKSTPGPQFGENLDWWTEAQYVVPIDKVFTVTDFATKKSFTIKRTIGATHADCEPYTPGDTSTIKKIFGGFTWIPRAVIIEVDNRKLAGSMTFYPHGVENISNNNFSGHFDLYFANCLRHKDNQPDPSHVKQVKIAAGIK